MSEDWNKEIDDYIRFSESFEGKSYTSSGCIPGTDVPKELSYEDFDFSDPTESRKKQLLLLMKPKNGKDKKVH